MPEEAKKRDKKAGRVTVHYLKSNSFRVIYTEGVHGGITPNGKIQMALYTERNPIPQQTQHSLEKVGEHAAKLGTEIIDERVGREGLIREVDTEILMDAGTAKLIGKWLLEQADEFERLSKKMQG